MSYGQIEGSRTRAATPLTDFFVGRTRYHTGEVLMAPALGDGQHGNQNKAPEP